MLGGGDAAAAAAGVHDGVSTYVCECADGSKRGPFDIVVDASGLEWLPVGAHAALGDARTYPFSIIHDSHR